MGPFSENHTLHGGAERRSPAAVPKIIPMQAGRGLRGPSLGGMDYRGASERRELQPGKLRDADWTTADCPIS